MEKKDKWLMFKQYMHNELNITKEDIRQWIQESVEIEANKLVTNAFNKFDIVKMVEDITFDKEHFNGKATIKREIANQIANRILENFNLNFTPKNNI